MLAFDGGDVSGEETFAFTGVNILTGQPGPNTLQDCVDGCDECAPKPSPISIFDSVTLTVPSILCRWVR